MKKMLVLVLPGLISGMVRAIIPREKALAMLLKTWSNKTVVNT
jgi:hypothetical protein